MVSWSETYGHPGLIFCVTQSTNNPLALYITPETITVQACLLLPLSTRLCLAHILPTYPRIDIQFDLQEVKVSMLNKASSSSKGNKVVDYVAMRYQTSHNTVRYYINISAVGSCLPYAVFT